MSVHIHSKEFKDLLKNFTRLSRISSSALAPITFSFDPFQVTMMTEHAFIISRPSVSIMPPVEAYSFNPEVLLDLSLTDGDVELYWADENAALNLKNNYLRTALRVAVPMPDFVDIPETMNSLEVPLGLLHAVEKFISVPYIFLNGFSNKKKRRRLFPPDMKKEGKASFFG